MRKINKKVWNRYWLFGVQNIQYCCTPKSEEVKRIETPKKMGRPKAEKPKNESIKVRFDSELFKELDDYCKKNNLTKAKAIRNGVKLLLDTKNK